MVKHEIRVQGIALNGVCQSRPALLQMNNEDFPGRFLTDLSAMALTPGSSITTMTLTPDSSATLYPPVQRVVHVALLDLACESVGLPRLDPRRVESAGLVIRRVVRNQGVDDFSSPPSAWMKSPDGQLQWKAMTWLEERQDPDPGKRARLQSGQPALDAMLAEQTLATAQEEIFTPAFAAPPQACEAAGHTFVYAVVPTASSDATTNPPATPQYDPSVLATGLPNLLKSGWSAAPYPNRAVDYRYMSDEYARSHGASSLHPFSVALTLLYNVVGAFQNTTEAQAIIGALNNFNIYDRWGAATPMGQFYQDAAAALLDYDPASGDPVPEIVMPTYWDQFSPQDADNILSLITASLKSRSRMVAAPTGRFQDASRFYRLRIFLRLKPHAPECPTELVWSKFSDPFRIAAWYESAGRSLSPVPLPDPADRNFLKNATPNCAFAVPASLMNAISGSTLSGLSSGTAPSGGVQLNWICGFNIPMITICAFFVLNIFLILLNLVFFWLPFIKICIPFPAAASSGDSDGT